MKILKLCRRELFNIEIILQLSRLKSVVPGLDKLLEVRSYQSARLTVESSGFPTLASKMLNVGMLVSNAERCYHNLVIENYCRFGLVLGLDTVIDSFRPSIRTPVIMPNRSRTRRTRRRPTWKKLCWTEICRA